MYVPVRCPGQCEHPLYLRAQFSLLLHPAHVLKDTSSLQTCDLPADPPTSCTNILAGVSQPSSGRREDWGAG